MEIVVFDKQKFDVFINAVSEEFKGKPTIMNILGGFLNAAVVPVQQKPMDETTSAYIDPATIG